MESEGLQSNQIDPADGHLTTYLENECPNSQSATAINDAIISKQFDKSNFKKTYNKSLEKLKDIVGFDHDANYTGREVESMFSVLGLTLINNLFKENVETISFDAPSCSESSNSVSFKPANQNSDNHITATETNNFDKILSSTNHCEKHIDNDNCEINNIDNCEINNIDNCEINNIDNCEINNIDNCEINNIDNCEINNIDNCEINNIDNCEINNIDNCEINNIDNCEINSEMSDDRIEMKQENCQENPIIGDNSIDEINETNENTIIENGSISDEEKVDQNGLENGDTDKVDQDLDDIDVDQLLTEEENSDNDELDKKNKKKKSDKNLADANGNEKLPKNDENDDSNDSTDRIRIPDILKSLEVQSNSNSAFGDDPMDSDCGEENDGEDFADNKDLFSSTLKEASEKENEKDDIDTESNFELDSTINDIVNNDELFGKEGNLADNNHCNEVEDIFNSVITNDNNGNNLSDTEEEVDDDKKIDEKDDKSKKDKKKVKSEEDDSGSNDESDKKFDLFDRLARQTNKLLNSDTDDDDENGDADPDSDNSNSSKDLFSTFFMKKNSIEKESKKKDDSDDNDDDAGRSNDRADSHDDDDDDDKIAFKKKKRPKKALLSDDENGDNNHNTDESSVSSNESEDSAPKTKRKKRKRVVASDSSDEDGEANDKSLNSSRKKIKKIIDDKKLKQTTRDAERSEKERRKRIEEKQKLYNELQDTKVLSSEINQVILDFDHETKEILVEVDKGFVKFLKPHQVDGVKFLYDNMIETVKRLKQEDHGSGCILAHSMGLGKTFQVVTFLHTILTNEHIKEKIRTVLIIVPYNVVKNWVQEFDKWFSECDIDTPIAIYEINNTKTLKDRVDLCKMWQRKGGIMIFTTSLFSSLVNRKKMNKKQLKQSEPMLDCLVDPGPDMVIIDEGHLLKNDTSVFNKAVSQIKTLRRSILTGTPLQNNLSEYFIMVDFVKPQLLGTKREFKNRFENPIINGQHIDSTDFDVKLMKKRVHILHKLLKDCIHRCDYNVLVPYLQPKFEYVLSLKLTETQTKLYRHYLDNLADKSRITNLFSDYSILRLIWNHPALLYEHFKRKEEKEEMDESDSMKDFVVDDSDSSTEARTRRKLVVDSSDSDVEFIEYKGFDNKVKLETDLNNLDENQRMLRDGKIVDTQNEENDPVKNELWWQKFMPEEIYDVELSAKFILLISILEQCEKLGDKILIFSQSLFNLDLIEEFLRLKMEEFSKSYDHTMSYDDVVQLTGGYSHRWLRNVDYFRIDGNVKCENRCSIIDKFNDPSNERARLMLVSTKAGGIGVNLVGANRCIIFDVSWNPSHDLQAIYRIFRYGQNKPVYVYRFTAFGTMENKIYERQIIKQSLSHRVIDEQQIQRHFKASEIGELYTFTEPEKNRPVLNLPKDRLLADIMLLHPEFIISNHEHDSLLENKPEEELTEEERKNAWTEYEKEKLPMPDPSLDQAFLMNLQQMQNMQHHMPNTTMTMPGMQPQFSRQFIPNGSQLTDAQVAHNYNKYYEFKSMLDQQMANRQLAQARDFNIVQPGAPSHVATTSRTNNYNPYPTTHQLLESFRKNNQKLPYDIPQMYSKLNFGTLSRRIVGGHNAELPVSLVLAFSKSIKTIDDLETYFLKLHPTFSPTMTNYAEHLYLYTIFYYKACILYINYFKQKNGIHSPIYASLLNSKNNLNLLHKMIIAKTFAYDKKLTPNIVQTLGLSQINPKMVIPPEPRVDKNSAHNKNVECITISDEE